MTLASALPRIIPRRLRLLRQRLLAMRDWRKRQFAAPSPGHIKERVLLRNGIPNAQWVETGTYLGDTTALLSRNARQVYSIEPAPALFEQAARRFRDVPNVKILHGTSEEVFPQLLPTLSGDLNFWLDGHYSAGMTYKGALDTPIAIELACIERNLARFSRMAVLVDDVRCFDPSIEEFAQYPELDFLVDWARRNRLKWHIEHDIFVARTPTSR
jgi:hypothetical protein